ncbi:MAG TPA: PqqD family protein [Streptosporangiaceae bacterium]|nr:PqqD family protein [Streptosporangiaceae bacterium]
MSTAVSGDTVVHLFPLHIGPEEDGVCEVGRPDTGTFIALPPEGVSLLAWLGDGLPVAEVLARFEAHYGVAPDLAEFLDGIQECGFIGAIGDRPTGTVSSPQRNGPRAISMLAGIPPRRLRWVLSRPVRLLSLALWAGVPALLIARPDLAPTPSDALVLPHVLVNALVLAPIAWALVIVHEFAHAITARALGCTGRLAISRRLWFLVAQTELVDVRRLPRRSRYAPYLAGMTWDLLVLACCLGAELAGAFGRWPRTIAYMLCLMLIYQFSVFMRTDIYYVVANWLRLGDLMGDTKRLVAHTAGRLLRRGTLPDLSDIPARELKIVRWYAWYYLLGSSAVTAAFLILSVPALVKMLRLAAVSLPSGPASYGFWDGLGFIALMALQFGTLAIVALGDRRRRAAPPRPAAPAGHITT